jgi:large subunit ribosomal protein L9
MEVILLEKIRNLGDLGQKVNVKRGFGRNFLVPEGKAVVANEANLAQFGARRAELEKKAADLLKTAQKRAESLAALILNLPARVGDEGKLYGSIGTREIAEAITSSGIEVQKSEVRLPEGAIRYTGEYDISLQLHSDVVANIKINVVPEA